MVCCPPWQSQRHLGSPQQQSAARERPGPEQAAAGHGSPQPVPILPPSLSSASPRLRVPKPSFLCIPCLQSSPSVSPIFRGLLYSSPLCSPWCGEVQRAVLDCPSPHLPLWEGAVLRASELADMFPRNPLPPLQAATWAQFYYASLSCWEVVVRPWHRLDALPPPAEQQCFRSTRSDGF